tara:strand:+ start:668 stop:1075 length:408 start_codon:yes stop_codon:yes gene_type:complete
MKNVRSYYSRRIIDHYENPRNVGSFLNNNDIGIGLVGAPACGDVMKMSIKVDKRTNRIVDARFKTFGCGSAIASSSLATEMIIGKSCDEALKVTNKMIANHLKLPPVKLHCSMLAEDAIKSAVNNYIKKTKYPIF